MPNVPRGTARETEEADVVERCLMSGLRRLKSSREFFQRSTRGGAASARSPARAPPVCTFRACWRRLIAKSCGLYSTISTVPSSRTIRAGMGSTPFLARAAATSTKNELAAPRASRASDSTIRWRPSSTAPLNGVLSRPHSVVVSNVPMFSSSMKFIPLAMGHTDAGNAKSSRSAFQYATSA